MAAKAAEDVTLSQEVRDLEQQLIELAQMDSEMVAESQQHAVAEDAALRNAAAAERRWKRKPVRFAAQCGAGAPPLSAATTRLVHQQAALTQLLRRLEAAPAAQRGPLPPTAPRPRTTPTAHPASAVTLAHIARPTAAQHGPELARLRVQAQEAAAAQVQLRATNESLRKQVAALADRECRLIAAQRAADVDREARATDAAAALLLVQSEQREAERLAEVNGVLRQELAEARAEGERAVAEAAKQAREAERTRGALQQRVEELEAVVCSLRGDVAQQER